MSKFIRTGTVGLKREVCSGKVDVKPQKKGQFRSNILPIIRIFEDNKIENRHKDHLKKTPFWLLIKACLDGGVSVTHVHNWHEDAILMMKMYVPSQKGFKIGKKLVVPFRSSDIESMFGIVDGEKKIEIKKYILKPKESPFYKRRFANDGQMTQKFIKDLIKDLVLIDSTEANEDVARLICIYLFICLFFTSTGTYIGWYFLTLVEDLDSMKDLAWSKAICDATLESIEKNVDTPWNLGGCVMALKYWLAMHTTLGKVEFPNEFPIFLQYNTTQLHVSLQEKLFPLPAKNIFKEEIPRHEKVTEMLARGRYAIVLYRQKDNQEEAAIVGVSNDEEAAIEGVSNDDEEESGKDKKDDIVEEEEEHSWQNERYSSNDNVQDNYGTDENEKTTMEQEVNELKVEKKNLEEANKKGEQENKKLMEENNNLKAEMEKMKEGMKEVKKRLRLISKEKEMERILQERETEIEEMKKRMEEMKEKNNSLLDEVERLRKESKQVRPSSLVIRMKTKARKKKELEDYEYDQLAKGQKIHGGKKDKKKEKKKGEKKKEQKKEEEEEEKEEEKRKDEKQEKEEEKGKVEAEKKKEEKKTEGRKDEKERKKDEKEEKETAKRKKEKEEEEEGKKKDEKEKKKPEKRKKEKDEEEEGKRQDEEEEGKREDEEAEKKKKTKKEDKKETKKRGTKRATTTEETPKAKKQRIETEDKAKMKHDDMETTMGDGDFVTPQPKALMVDDDIGTKEKPLTVDNLVTPTEKEDEEKIEWDDAKYPVWGYLENEDKEKIMKMQHYEGQSAIVWSKQHLHYMITFSIIRSLIEEKEVSNSVIEVYMELLRDEQTDNLMPDKVFFFTTNTLAYITKENLKKICERMIDANIVDAHRHKKMVIPIFSREDEEKGTEDHWTVVIADNETGEWCHYNSFRPNKRNDKYFEDAKIVKEYLNKKRKGGPSSNGKWKSATCPQQKNGTDCGIFMISVIDKAFRGQEQMKRMSLTHCQRVRAYLVHKFINDELSWDEKSYLDLLNETTKLAEKEEEKRAQRQQGQIEEQEKGGEHGDPATEGND